MKVSKIKYSVLIMFFTLFIFTPNTALANLTKEQAEDVALFATSFIEKGNQRRDENGYPLLVYALSNNWQTCIEIRRSGYQEKLYHVKNNAYHMKNGKYLDLGLKWCMDCGDYISYIYKTTLGFDMFLEETQDPWHIKDIYADANKGEKSEYFYFVYKNVPISSILEENLEKGDIVLRLGSRENHGLIYVGQNMQTAHASRNAIKYAKNPQILGFEVVQLNKFYKSSTIVSIARVKDGVVSPEQIVNSTIIWPDNGEVDTLLPLKELEYEQEEEDFNENKNVEIRLYDKIELNGKIELNSEIELSKINNPIIEEKIRLLFSNLKIVKQPIEDKIVDSVSEIEQSKNGLRDQIWKWFLFELKRLLMQL